MFLQFDDSIILTQPHICLINYSCNGFPVFTGSGNSFLDGVLYRPHIIDVNEVIYKSEDNKPGG